MSRIAESKHIYFGTVDALSSWSCRPAGDTFDLYVTFLFVANDGKRDRRSGRPCAHDFGPYVLLNPLRPFVIVKLPSDLADTLIQ